MKSFREFVSIKEGTTVRPGMPNQNNDKEIDDKIANNPDLLMGGTNPKNQMAIKNAITKYKVKGGQVPLAAALKAATMMQKHVPGNIQ
jgi:hypothetical protein